MLYTRCHTVWLFTRITFYIKLFTTVFGSSKFNFLLTKFRLIIFTFKMFVFLLFVPWKGVVISTRNVGSFVCPLVLLFGLFRCSVHYCIVFDICLPVLSPCIVCVGFTCSPHQVGILCFTYCFVLNIQGILLYHLLILDVFCILVRWIHHYILFLLLLNLCMFFNLMK